MGLSLTAEQKAILKIFKIEEQYVVPAYQRPYSWGYDHCFQLYNDLFEAFKSNEDYFIGNIIIAKSDADKDVLEIIDGQQRLITLLLLVKVLYLLFPELKVLKQILEQEDWEGNKSRPRIKSDIFEANDENELQKVFSYSKEDLENRLNNCRDKKGNFSERRCNNRFEINILYFYDWFIFYKKENDNLKLFIEFLLKRVYLLPIELTGKTLDEANEKALVIFETINNRGMNLEDADIFKAKLYKKARKVNEADKFIDLWKELKYSTENLGLGIDDIFRYYSHIIRGKEGVTSSEINLREFFTSKKYSPFELKKYNEILDELFHIIEVLSFYEDCKRNNSDISKWIQIIDIYTNQYPKFAVVTYFFSNGYDQNNTTIVFLKSLIRYIYYQGSTTRVKFEIYSIIKNIFINKPISEYYYKDITVDYFDYLGRLKYGFALLSFYFKNEGLSNYHIEKFISYKDEQYLTDDWKEIQWEDFIDSLGNFVVLDIPKKNIALPKKIQYYSNSNVKEVNELSKKRFTYQVFKERDNILKERLVKFFKGIEI